MLKSFYSVVVFLPGFTLSDGPAAVVLFFPVTQLLQASFWEKEVSQVSIFSFRH